MACVTLLTACEAQPCRLATTGTVRADAGALADRSEGAKKRRRAEWVERLQADAEYASCKAPLRRLCAIGGCLAYEQAVAEARRAAPDSVACGDGGALVVYELGRCGAVRYLTTGGGFGGATSYFDASGASGAMVGQSLSTDYDAFCNETSTSID